MDDRKWLNELEIKHIPNEELRLVAEYCGMKAVIALIKYMPGVVIYVPCRTIIELRNKYIKKRYDGTKKSMLALSNELKLSEKTISKILRTK